MRILGIVAIIAVTGFQSVAAADTLPDTFSECVFALGNVRLLDGDMTCRYVRLSDIRIYGTAETACGEQVDIEIWDVTRDGVLTYAIAPAKTQALPEIGVDWASWTSTPMACLDT